MTADVRLEAHPFLFGERLDLVGRQSDLRGDQFERLVDVPMNEDATPFAPNQ
jgi:hypothetical protein